MSNEFFVRKNPLEMYVVQLVSEGSEYDTEETFLSNRQIILTCLDYVVMDLRDESDRAKTPTDIAIQEMYDGFMDELEDDIKEYMKLGKRAELERLLKIMAPNKFTPIIKTWLKTGGKPIDVDAPRPEANERHRIKIKIG